MVDAYHALPVPNHLPTMASLDPRHWSLQYREPNDLAPPDTSSPQMLSPPLAQPRPLPNSHSPSSEQAHQDHARRSPFVSAQESGPGPSTWKYMQQSRQNELRQYEHVAQEHHPNSTSSNHRPTSIQQPSTHLNGSGLPNGRVGSGEKVIPSRDRRRSPLQSTWTGSHEHTPNDARKTSREEDQFRDAHLHSRTTNGAETRWNVQDDTSSSGPPDPGTTKWQKSRTRYEDGRLGVLPPGESSQFIVMRSEKRVNKLKLNDFQTKDQTRDYKPIKLVGDGSFGTVWLCDWKSELASTTVLSAMQCGAGAWPEWTGKRLVAVKRMKRVWEGGWKEASQLGELVVSTFDWVNVDAKY